MNFFYIAGISLLFMLTTGLAVGGAKLGGAT